MNDLVAPLVVIVIWLGITRLLTRGDSGITDDYAETALDQAREEEQP